MSAISIAHVRDEVARREAETVLTQVYVGEKGWLDPGRELLPPQELDDPDISWLLCRDSRGPCGTTRIRYRPSPKLVADYCVEPVDPSFDVAEFLERSVVVEVGRFAVLRSHRRRWPVAAALIREAIVETFRRGATHLITDVFEEEENSPYGFHRRVLGFELIAFHQIGELRHEGRRATLVLDLERALERARRQRRWLDRHILDRLDEVGDHPARGTMGRTQEAT